MKGGGLRRYLQPLLYFGVAIGVHSLLILIPVPVEQDRTKETTRGIRARVVREGPPKASPPAAPAPRTAAFPTLSEGEPGGPVGGGRSGGDVPSASGQGSGAPGGAPAAGGGAEGGRGDSAFDSYLARLRSEGVQGWARDSAGRAKRGWKGSGKGGGGWGSGSGYGSGSGGGTGSGDGTGPGGGSGGKGAGTGGGGYLDPRVQVVVTSYPLTSIEKKHGNVRYPDKKIKKHQYSSGWQRVFIQLNTDPQGNVAKLKVLEPTSEGPLQRIFVQAVQDEISRWTFDRQSAEINVDVRFYVE